jgi:hypothetical protein
LIRKIKTCNENITLKGMTRIAYIITAYIDEKHLKRLIEALNMKKPIGECDFYIHVDNKVDIKPFTNETKYFNNVSFITKRYRIYWGGMNQVWSQYELLKAVFESGKIYDRIACLSGTDYPIWSNKRIANAFGNPDIEYIAGYNITNGNSKGQLSKINTYHFFRDKLHFLCTPARLLMTYLHIFRNPYIQHPNGKRYDIYMGSDYWALTYQCAKYVFNIISKDHLLTKYFKHSFAPSEMVVNTIVMNSEYKLKTVIYKEKSEFPGLFSLTPLHHIVYGKNIKTYRLEDLQELLDSDKMFFRKARTGFSDTLIARLNELRNK